MKLAIFVSALIAVVIAVPVSNHASGRLSAVSCAESIYTTPANMPPKPVQAVVLGAAVFNSLAHLTSPRDLGRPSKELPFYTVKSPLTILAQARQGATIRVVHGGKNVALLYSRTWLRRLSAWHYNFSDVPRSVRLPLCRDDTTKLPVNTQYAGGFLLRKPGCITIEVQAVGETRAQRTKVPVGVRHC